MLAQVLLFSGQPDAARSVLEAGLSLHPTDPAFFSALGQVHSRLGDEAAAQRYHRLHDYIMDEATDGFHPPAL